MKIGVVSDFKNIKTKHYLIKKLKKEGFNVKNISTFPCAKNCLINECKQLMKAFQNKKVDRAIVLDDYGVGSFMYLSKFPHMVVAEISDEHSAIMTTGHNNSNVITLATKVITKEQIVNISKYFLKSKFEGGRHFSRLDMLDEISKEGWK